MEAKKKKIALALFVAMFLAAFEGTVIATAAATIVKDLQGFDLVSWVFSLYLLTSAISTPIYGKLADLYGRKSILSIGIAIFLAGSLFCGFAESMMQLVIFRAVQGLGAGSILTVTFTIIGDVFTLKERSIVQGGISTVWGIAGLIGPLIGGFLIDALSWHWIFFINIPFGLVCLIILRMNLADTKPQARPNIDYAGTLALSCVIGSFLYGVMIGYADGTFLHALIVTLLSTLVFYRVEKTAREPIVPFSILTKPAAIINIISFFAAMILIAVNVYLPLYIQTILGYSATIAGLSLATMSVSWFLCATVIASAMEKYGARAVIIAASLILVASCYLLSTLTVASSLYTVSLYAFLFGFSFSGTLNTLTFMVQDSVGYEQRGAAVGLNALTRTLAQAVGVSIFGTLINIKLGTYFAAMGLTHVDTGDLYAPQNALSIEQIHAALQYALHFVFLTLIVISAAACFFSLFLPPKSAAAPHARPEK